MINTAIGLILLYSLLSLLASAIQESIAGWLSLRGRMLDQALAQMLGKTPDAPSTPPTEASPAGAAAPINLYEAFLQHDWFLQLVPKKSWLGSIKAPSYLDKRTFSTILLHVLDGTSTAHVQEALDKLPAGSLKNFLLDLLADANNDIERFRKKLEQWYDLTMDRVSGWYKRKTHSLLLIIGLVLASLFNADTFAVYQRVAADPQAQEEVVALAQKLLDQHLQLPDSLRQDSLLLGQLDSTHALIQDLNGQLSEAAVPLGLGWTQAEWGALKKAPLSVQLFKLLGLIVTAFAISLGAPFWFDLLQQFVNIRNAGQKPSGSPSAAS